MHFLCIGDQHIQPNNLPQIQIFIDKLEEHLNPFKLYLQDNSLISLQYLDNNYDFIVMMGDCLHTHEKIYTQSLSMAKKLISCIATYSLCFVLLGNHDIINNSQEFPDDHPFVFASEMKNVTIINKMTLFKKFDIDFIITPYVPDNRLVPLLDENIPSWKNVSFILGHQLIKGAKMGAITSETGDDWKPEYPHLISGHVHDKQWVKDNMYYVGSILQHSFGEQGKKSLLCIDIPKKSNKKYMTEIFLDLPTKQLIYLDSIKKLYKYVPPNNENTKIKLSISGSFEDFKAFKESKKYKELLDSGIKVIFKYKREEIVKTSVKKSIKKFNEILHESVIQENNIDLLNVYNEIIA